MSNAILSSNSNLSEVVKAETAIIDQLPTLLLNATLFANGVQMTMPEVIAALKAHIASVEAAEAAKAQLHALVVAQWAQRASVRAIVAALKAYIAATQGTASAAYTQLGFAPATRVVITAAEKAEAAEKRLATRAARRTMGKRQRADIHGAPASPGASAPPVAAPPVAATPAAVVKPSGG